ncbi:Arc family DNA-binding protein [Pararobbsia alpina]|uniref:Arc-like DNA binding domain-containing protein n=1 Tax=Pararobbsia alpina TaxID=621374 RepID=A0A6S7B149_9BURK|nr:Arc family DNA-binding protein [Pararobbsia alpina]CAB3784224.1 hypothetical protein LMG28138_01766 [Pararobbsia alpina]
MARSDPQVNIRMPQELKGRLDAASEGARRSLNLEIVRRLEDSFSESSAHKQTEAALKTFVAASEAQKQIIDVQRRLLERVANMMVLSLDLDPSSSNKVTQQFRDITRRFGQAIAQGNLAEAMEPIVEMVQIGKQTGILDDTGQVKPEHEHLKPKFRAKPAPAQDVGPASTEGTFPPSKNSRFSLQKSRRKPPTG